MSTTIDAVATVTGRRTTRRSALKLADAAVRECLVRGGAMPNDIGLLLNAGLYRDRDLGEPALAALIQADVGANDEDPHPGVHGTFSLDVANGACGVLTALQIADDFLRAGTIDSAVVVASDADPGRGHAAGFPYSPAGAAALCRRGDGSTGLLGFHWATTTKDEGFYRSRVIFERRRNRLRIEEDQAYAERAAALTAEAAGALLERHGVGPDDIDLVIPGLLAPGYLDLLPGLLKVPADRLVTVPGAERVHTAALLFTWDAAQRRRLLDDARLVLLVSAGAGLVAGAALFAPT